MGASIDAQCGAEASVSHVIAKATAIGDRINVTKRALPSPFKSEVPVLPGPPPNKINGLTDILAPVATVVGDRFSIRCGSSPSRRLFAFGVMRT